MYNLPRLFTALTFCAAFTVTSGCGGNYNNYNTDNPDPMDRPADLNREDFIKALSPRPEPEVKVEVKEPPLPKIVGVLSAPKPPKIASDKTVSISVTEDVQLKDIFLELSRLADIDIEVAPNIRGGVIFKATNKPVSEVVERISELAGLRYSVNGGILRIEKDVPYVENYPASFLNIVRKNKSKIENSNKLSGAGTGGAAGGGGGNGSESSITTDSGGEGDIWASIESQISSILGISADKAASSGGAAAPAAGNKAAAESFVSINRNAGVISVSASSKDQEKVRQYLEQVKSYYSAQVLIEAKVVEVALNDEYRSGIDWTVFSKNLNGGMGINTNFTGFPTSGVIGGANSISITGLGGGNITDSVITLGQVFGTTRTLSSPRILAMNNQQAVLSFATNETYFAIDCELTDAVITNGEVTTPGKVNITSTINTIPVGIILNIQNSIDTKNNNITMNVRPTLSRLTGKTTEDPSTAICVASAQAQGSTIGDIKSIIPQVDVREMDSVLTLKSGEIMAIGGMIEQKNINNDSGVPYASEIPVFGNAFKNVDKQNSVVQTVILLKATIVPAYGVDEYDQKLYNKFNTDPRPFKF